MCACSLKLLKLSVHCHLSEGGFIDFLCVAVQLCGDEARVEVAI